jgi:hypothetical protein
LSLSLGSLNAASWSADQGRKALCLTKGVTSPFAHAMKVHFLIQRVNEESKIVMSELHDVYDKKKKKRAFRMDQRQDVLTRIMLDDYNIGTFCKLASGVAETVLCNKIE